MNHESCPIDLSWEMKQGVKEYIQGETDKDPYYALVTGALHGAPVDYTQTQPFVDEIVAQGPERFTDASFNEKFLNTPIRGSAYEMSRQRAPVLAELSRCYIKGRREGLGDVEAALDCTDYTQLAGVGRKGANLMREYLGDENAVAVDRHVWKYACMYRGFCPVGEHGEELKVTYGNHGVRIPEKVQVAVEGYIKDIAAECDKTAAEVQVAAWLKGACDSKIEERIKKRGGDPQIYLGEDFSVNCGKRFYESPSTGILHKPSSVRRDRPPRKVQAMF
jgi:endonuclease III